MAKQAKVLESAPTLSLEELQEIKFPLDLFDLIPILECKKSRVMPLRMDDSTKTLSFIFVDENTAQPLLDDLNQKRGFKHVFGYRIEEADWDIIIKEFSTESAPDKDTQEISNSEPKQEENEAIEVDEDSKETGWTIALIETDIDLRTATKKLLESQAYDVVCFDSENDFKTRLQELADQLSEDDDLLDMAENQKLVPFQAVLVRKKALHTPKTFCDFVWAHFSHLRVSVLEDRWMNSILERATLQVDGEADEFGFHLRHGNFYHAAIECLKKGNIFQGVELLEQVKDEDAHYIKAKILLGKAFLKKRNYNKASDHFQKAYDHWCEDPEGLVDDVVLKLLYHLAYTFDKLGRLDDALKLYERVAAENPLFREVGQRLARVKEKRRKAIKAGERKMGMPAFSKAVRNESRYERMEEIGKGGMGIVFRAKDRVLGREVALKILNSHFKHDEKIVETFLREAKSLASLNHLNIVTIFDAGIEDGNYYISMEFIDGKTVRDLLKKKGYFKLSTALALSRQVLKALAYAHSKHVIHRDITTNNMMITETKVVKLMDFGLARVVNQLHSEQSIIGGTPYFMSPEQVEGAPIDHRTDVYSFGVCLFEMLTGQVPFPMENPGYHHLHTAPPDPRSIKSDIPDQIAQTILKCLEKKPEDRYQSADDILNQLRSFVGEESSKQNVKR